MNDIIFTTNSQGWADMILSRAADEILDDEDGRPADCSVEEVATYLRRFKLPEKELNINMLREHITWAKKSKEVNEPFVADWKQTVWLEAKSDQEFVFDSDEDMYRPKTGVVVQEDFCGTAGCLAGNIALRNAAQVVWEPMYEAEDGKTMVGASFVKTDVGMETIEKFAGDQLGINIQERALLFASDNSIEDLERIAEGICARRGLTY